MFAEVRQELSEGLRQLCLRVAYFAEMHLHLRRKQISFEVALFAVLAFVGPERYLRLNIKLTFPDYVSARDLSSFRGW